ncbi:AAA family ATPase [Herbidospora mongoliensis]|uniref:AAA family ATPase n=1 Tax=Herbidospora mongoliensis TaxID=688067 RepID=UPI000830CABF|nr:AAA family ATPase [Herbidospora mongoliensis]
MNTHLHETAARAHAAGLAVIPASTNGLKQPWPGGPSWDEYKTRRPTLDEINGWFAEPGYDGLGLVTGQVSGGLEMFELEGRAIAEGLVEKFAALLADHGLTDVWRRIVAGYLELTPTGGLHILYRVDGGEPRGNRKLAQRPTLEHELTEQQREVLASKPGKVFPSVLIETRGEGGFVIIAPSNGRTHPSGKTWTLAQGGLDTIATITEDERDALHIVAMMLDTMPAPAAPVAPARANRTADHHDVLRPGDDYNQRADWREILEPHGWRHVRNYGRARGWLRPGKTHGNSATTGTNDADNLYVFSSSTEFDTEEPYSKFAAYVLLEHGGDWSAATSALRALGYGGELPPPDPFAGLLLGDDAHPFGEAANQAAAPDTTTPSANDDEEGQGDAVEQPLTAEQAREIAFERAVEQELVKVKIREEAQRRARRQRAGTAARPPIITLDEFLSVPDDPVRYRVEGLWPAGGRVMLAAQFKAGKTTLVGNLVRSLVDSTPFLGRHQVEPFAGKVGILDDELDERMIRAWLREQGIENTSAAAVVSLRGRLSTFDILDPVVRSEWATALREAGITIVVLDCLAPILDALGLSEDKEAGRFLVAFDEMLKEAGVSEAVVVHHMGHSGERSRGASRLRDWPDVEWRLVREKSDDGETNPAAPRYFSAYGRDVEIPESLLAFDPVSRRLEIAGGSRKDEKDDRVLEEILDYLTLTPGASGRQITEAFTESPHGRDGVRAALARGVKSKAIRTGLGPRRATLHWAVEPATQPATTAEAGNFSAPRTESSAREDHDSRDPSDLILDVSAGQAQCASAREDQDRSRQTPTPVRGSAPDSPRTEPAGHSVSAPVRGQCADDGAVSAPVRPPLGGGAHWRTDSPPPATPPTKPRSKYGNLATCESCDEQMVILAAGQTRHPMCSPPAKPAPPPPTHEQTTLTEATP